MRVLYISDFILAEEQGAKHLTISHYRTLVEIFGSDNVDVISINSIDKPWNKNFIYIEKHPTKFRKMLNIICGSSFFLSKRGENIIVDLCKKNNYCTIFVDHSIYGFLIKRIKKECNLSVSAFFHGIMAYQTEEYQKNNKTSFLYFIPKINTKQAEKLTVDYSDKCILLNSRDGENLKKYYGREADLYLPVYLEENDNITNEINTTDRFELLFVGGYFWPNIHGITWFVDNVMPRLPKNICLTIVGNKMDILRKRLEGDNVIVKGRVDSLDGYYNNADAVVGPIFEGEGMKTKTTEALMYGKLYIGTDESLIGFNCYDEYRSNNVDEFVKTIIRVSKSEHKKFYQKYRDCYIKDYSPTMAKKKLTDMYLKMGIL